MMQNKYNKMLGRLAAHLVTTLNAENHQIFSFQDAEKILGTRAAGYKVTAQLVKNGVAVRLKPGLFRLIPYDLGFEGEYLGNPYSVAKALVLNNWEERNDYYLSYASAFELHQMTTQPQFVVYTSTSRFMRSTTIQGTEFRFVQCKKEDIFGISEIWIDKTETVSVSDLERTLLDGLKQPVYCGGISEVAKGFSMKQDALNPDCLIEYALKLDIGAVIRRLGYLMELYRIGFPGHLEALQAKLTSTYQLLDPELPADGHYIRRWRLHVNIPEEELIAVRKT